jgi:hypothetical protein
MTTSFSSLLQRETVGIGIIYANGCDEFFSTLEKRWAHQ